jgi:hypothetical protein
MSSAPSSAGARSATATEPGPGVLPPGLDPSLYICAQTYRPLRAAIPPRLGKLVSSSASVPACAGSRSCQWQGRRSCGLARNDQLADTAERGAWDSARKRAWTARQRACLSRRGPDARPSGRPNHRVRRANGAMAQWRIDRCRSSVRQRRTTLIRRAENSVFNSTPLFNFSAYS